MIEILPLLIPLIVKLIDHLSPADAETVRAKLNQAVDRRVAAVNENELGDAPQDDPQPPPPEAL